MVFITKNQDLILKILYLGYILFSLSIISVHSAYISEIKFTGEEFVEILSNNSINFSDAKIYDDNGYSKYNTVSLLKKDPTSNLTLIVGDSFLESYNISKLNCSVYLTSSTQVSKGGLKINGEDLLIKYDSNNSYFKFELQEELNFNVSQSLNLNKNGSYFIHDGSPCNLSLPINYQDINIEDNNNSINNSEQLITDQPLENSSTNNENSTSSSNQSFSCNYSFSIIPKFNLTHEKIQFEFETNSTQDYKIEYWVEDFKKNIVKNKFNSTNTNLKTYTPNLNVPEIFYINSNIYFDSCDNLNDTKKIFYYPINGNSNYDEVIDKIQITNEDQIIKKQTNKLYYKFSRGNNSKNQIKLYLNDDKISSIKLEELSSIEGYITLDLNKSRVNNIKISGLGLEENIIIPKSKKTQINDSNKKFHKNNSNLNSTTNNSKIKENKIDWINDAPSFYFNLSFYKFDLISNQIYFNITYPLNYNFKSSSNCKILQGRKVISNIISGIDFGENNLTFEKNISIINFSDSKINCRIDPNWRTTPIYFDLDLSFVNKDILNKFKKLNVIDDSNIDNSSNNIVSQNKTNNISSDVAKDNNDEINIFDNFSYQNRIDYNLGIKLDKSEILDGEKPISYESKQSSFKQNAFFGLFIGSLLLTISFLFFF